MNSNPNNSQYRRIIIRRGNEYLLFKTDEIAYFFLENKTCYMVDRIQGIKYLISKSLRDLTMALDPADFYRINKKYLVHIESLRKFKLCVAGRIEVELFPVTREKVFINQVRMQDFKKWVTQGSNEQASPLFEDMLENQIGISEY
ncbi:MAG TPA: LytTR family DNA-binding domain-containing protein [Puia sp.]|nr:LytTR family DNA-binding domain-containing protein [Puia sp.]